MVDPDEVRRTLRVLLADQVTEIRVLEAVIASNSWPHTAIGYFDRARELVNALRVIKSAKGIYLVPNPIDPALLARAANRLKKADRGESTSDADITARRWFLVDCDPCRPSGISSTDDEHNAALERASAVREYLRQKGLPEPVMADSGNGAHLLYRVDLPVNDGGLLQRCLAVLAARFDDERVTIDRSVFNPARIWKLYGTRACKGDSTPDRPHRMSRILAAPNPVAVVENSLLEALVAEAAADSPARPETNGHCGAFDIDSFISRHGLELDGPDEYQGGRRWAFRQSPMCEHHGDGPFLIQFANGALCAGCHHTSCKDKWGWKELRARFDTTRQPSILNKACAEQVTIPFDSLSTVDGAWPEIQRFDEIDLPAFPAHVLPDVLRHWVEAEAHATQTPPDLAGMLSLSICSLPIARVVEVEPRRGWRESTNLYTVVLLAPANRKSAVFNDATQPIREKEEQLVEAARPHVARAESERRQDEARLKKLENSAAGKGLAEDRHAASELAAELAQQVVPVLPRLIVDDITSEKLGIMLAEQGGKVASMSPEGGVFDLMAGLYSKSGIAQFDAYLKGHCGDDLITDRVSRKGVRVERPAVVCAFAIQPQVIEGLAGKSAFRGRGLLGRFLYGFPRSLIGQRKIAPKPVPADFTEAYYNMVHLLFRQCENIDTASGDPLILRMSDAAMEMLERWEEEIESELDDGGEMELITDWGGKLAGATVRIAAVLHCIEHGPHGRIDHLTLSASIEIARYLIPHAEAALRLMEAQDDPTQANALYVLRWI
jgi:hypothetical protein